MAFSTFIHTFIFILGKQVQLVSQNNPPNTFSRENRKQKKIMALENDTEQALYSLT